MTQKTKTMSNMNHPHTHTHKNHTEAKQMITKGKQFLIHIVTRSATHIVKYGKSRVIEERKKGKYSLQFEEWIFHYGQPVRADLR